MGLAGALRELAGSAALGRALAAGDRDRDGQGPGETAPVPDVAALIETLAALPSAELPFAEVATALPVPPAIDAAAGRDRRRRAGTSSAGIFPGRSAAGRGRLVSPCGRGSRAGPGERTGRGSGEAAGEGHRASRVGERAPAAALEPSRLAGRAGGRTPPDRRQRPGAPRRRTAVVRGGAGRRDGRARDGIRRPDGWSPVARRSTRWLRLRAGRGRQRPGQAGRR